MAASNSVEDLLSTEELAELLNVDRKSVTRYAGKKMIPCIKKTEGFFFKIEDAHILRDEISEYKKHKSYIKEMYVLNRCGAEPQNIACQFDLKEDGKEVALALRHYERHRENYLNQFYLGKETKKDALLLEEVCSRLKIRDTGVIYNLIREGCLNQCPLSKDKERVFISSGSFIKYLGKNAKLRFYTSRNASAIIHKSVNMIDKLALESGIGRKLRNRRRSIYLFTIEEIYALKYLKRKKRYK